MVIAEFDKSSRNVGLRAKACSSIGFPLGSTRLILPWTKSEHLNGSVASVPLGFCSVSCRMGALIEYAGGGLKGSITQRIRVIQNQTEHRESVPDVWSFWSYRQGN